jgi:hypothetical protein
MIVLARACELLMRMPANISLSRVEARAAAADRCWTSRARPVCTMRGLASNAAIGSSVLLKAATYRAVFHSSKRIVALPGQSVCRDELIISVGGIELGAARERD